MCNLSLIKNLYFITLITLITPTTLTTNTTLTNLITPTSPTQNNICKRFVRSINFQNLQQKKDPEWLDVKQLLKFAKKMSSNTICKKIVRSRQFEIQSQVASCPLRQFAKFTNKVVQDNNLYNLQKKLARTAICKLYKQVVWNVNLCNVPKNCPEQKFARTCQEQQLAKTFAWNYDSQTSCPEQQLV